MTKLMRILIFADNTVLLAGENKDLEDMLNGMDDLLYRNYSMKVNEKKTR